MILGFRIGGFAYLTDCNGIPEESLDLLQGLDCLVLDALRRRPHPTHFTLDQAVEMARRSARAAPSLPTSRTNSGTRDLRVAAGGMALAYDGLCLEVA